MSSGLAIGSIGLLPPANPFSASILNQASGTTVYTVPTGKTAYIQGVTIIGEDTQSIYTFKVATVSVFGASLLLDSTFFASGNPLFIATSGQAITLVDDGSGSVSGSIWGYLL